MELKTKILEKATDQFFKYGIRSVTMDDLAREVGISKKTLYQNYGDKDELVFEVTENFLKNEVHQCDVMHRVSKNPIDELMRTTEVMREMFSKTNPALLLDLRKYHPKAWELYVVHKEFIKGVIMRNLRQGIDSGYYRSEMNVEVIAQMRLEIVEMAFEGDRLPSGKFGLLEVQMQIFDHFLNGILTEKGRKLINKLSSNNKYS